MFDPNNITAELVRSITFEQVDQLHSTIPTAIRADATRRLADRIETSKNAILSGLLRPSDLVEVVADTMVAEARMKIGDDGTHEQREQFFDMVHKTVMSYLAMSSIATMNALGMNDGLTDDMLRAGGLPVTPVEP